ncbi:FkbM family methyltransferase [Akkermansiaceae bacterium]|nr:FkbM family methyltransferase [Akkermansiaceae bacterium]
MINKLIQSALSSFDYQIRSTKHFGDNYWNDLALLMRRQPSEKSIIMDVGAHHGETLIACRKSFPDAMIHCFEPDPESQEILKNCASNLEKVKIHELALGSAAAQAEFHRNSASMTNSLLPTSAESLESDYADYTKTQEVIQVSVETLDEICARENIGWIDLLKTDCQGYDLMVLQGGEKMISSHQVGLITCEVIFDQEYDGQGRFHELLRYLDSFGYRLIGFYNMSRNRDHVCTYCDAIFERPIGANPS